MLFIVVALINFPGGDHVRYMYFVKNISFHVKKTRTVNDRKANFKKFAMNVTESLDVIISTHASFSSCELVTHISLRAFRFVSKLRVTVSDHKQNFN